MIALFVCPRDLHHGEISPSRADKHSDLRKDPDTVMAVATDSHRDFLIPEYTLHGVYPTTPSVKCTLGRWLVLFYCVWIFYTIFRLVSSKYLKNKSCLSSLRKEITSTKIILFRQKFHKNMQKNCKCRKNSEKMQFLSLTIAKEGYIILDVCNARVSH